MVYIQSDKERLLPHHFDAACALYGARDNGQEVRLTSLEEVVSGKFDSLIKQHLFAGSVEFMTEVWKRIRKDPKVPKNSNRSEEHIKLRELRELIKIGHSYFAKPVQNKLFTGMVFDLMTISSLKDLSEDTELIIATPFRGKIQSEWRCYVHLNKILDIRNYSGDQWILPKKEYVEFVIKENYETFPDSYTIDIGILENGSNVVIEFNDGWSTGNYGIDNSDYYKYLRSRYFQIVRAK